MHYVVYAFVFVPKGGPVTDRPSVWRLAEHIGIMMEQR